MNYAQLMAELAEIQSRMLGDEELAEADLDTAQARAAEILGELERLDAEAAAEAERAAAQADLEARISSRVDGWSRVPAVPGVHRVAGQAWDMDAVRRASDDELASRAQDAVDALVDVPDSRREALSVQLSRAEGDPARLMLTTTSPAYRSAFAKLVTDRGSKLTDAEREAVDFAAPLARAMAAGTNNAGGYLVPTDIEPSVTLADDGTNNPIYDLARKVQTTSTTYRVVTATNATWSWDGENTEASDDTPTFANVDIPLYVAQGFVPVSFAAIQSVAGAVDVAGEALRAGWADLVGAALATGSGSSQPTGIITALAGGSSVVSPATAETFAVADVYAVEESIGRRHRRNATWLAHNKTINDIRQFATDDGHALLARLGDGAPSQLLGRPIVDCEDMDDTSTINAAATADNYVLLFGDFRHYVIAEGWGSMVRIIPDVMGSNGRPIGAQGVYMSTRFGADSVLDAAFGVLNVATTA